MILVVGAVPVSLTMAARLARFGLPIRIIDKPGGDVDLEGGEVPKVLQPEPRAAADGRIEIVRSDGYVGFSGGAEDFEGTETYLGRLSGLT